MITLILVFVKLFFKKISRKPYIFQGFSGFLKQPQNIVGRGGVFHKRRVSKVEN